MCPCACIILHRRVAFASVPVNDVTGSCPSWKSFRLRAPSGYLTGRTSSGSPIGTEACPWMIRVPAGERIRVTLYTLTGGEIQLVKSSCRGGSRLLDIKKD